MVEPGQLFGELSLSNARGRIRGTTARALAASEAFEVEPGDFLVYTLQNRPALEALIFTLCLRLTDAEDRIEVMPYRGAEQRLGRLLLHLATSRECKGRS